MKMIIKGVSTSTHAEGNSANRLYKSERVQSVRHECTVSCVWIGTGFTFCMSAGSSVPRSTCTHFYITSP